jgi:hypothetical protein
MSDIKTVKLTEQQATVATIKVGIGQMANMFWKELSLAQKIELLLADDNFAQIHNPYTVKEREYVQIHFVVEFPTP